jgi:hypothetical protein
MSLNGDCSYLSDAHIDFLNKINKDKKQINEKEYTPSYNTKNNSNYQINSTGSSMSLSYYNNNKSVCKLTSQ